RRRRALAAPGAPRRRDRDRRPRHPLVPAGGRRERPQAVPDGPPHRLHPPVERSARRDLQPAPVDHRRRRRRAARARDRRRHPDAPQLPAGALHRLRVRVARRGARLLRRVDPAAPLPARRVEGAEGGDGRARPLLRDRRRRHRVHVPVPGVRERRDDDGPRADHRHPAAVRVGRRVVAADELPRARDPAGDPHAARRAAGPMKKKASKLGPLAVLSVVRELRRGAGELVPLLARELRAGGDASAVVEGRIDGAAALVWIGPPDEEQLRRADRDDIPIVAVTDAAAVPYVLATDLVRVPPGQGFPVEEIAAALAGRLGENGTSLAARLPVLRRPVCAALTASFARRNGLIAAAVFVPGVDLPVLTLNQVRLVLRIALAYGEELDNRRALELLGVVGAGFGFRAAARELLDLVPVAGWAVKGAVAYSGTRAIGEAAVRYFEARK